MNATDVENYLAALDVGTTSVRCHIINSKAKCVSASSLPINLIYPYPGYVEIDPNDLWDKVCTVIKQAISGANLSEAQIKCLGISTQRSTFTTWRKDTGKTFHNFITWKDLRADDLVNYWNASCMMKCFRMSCYVLHFITRIKRYAAGSSLNLANTQATIRLLWVLENIPELREALPNKNVMFGTIDTWLIYKFTAGRLHVTDITNASATGFFDPFVLSWAKWANVIFKIPFEILPSIVANDYAFGSTNKDIFGTSIPIKCVISDQSASMFGSCCFKHGDAKVTLGTGSFIDINTNSSLHSGAGGLYPLVGWKLKDKITYFVEGACNDTGSIIEWALKADSTGWCPLTNTKVILRFYYYLDYRLLSNVPTPILLTDEQLPMAVVFIKFRIPLSPNGSTDDALKLNSLLSKVAKNPYNRYIHKNLKYRGLINNPEETSKIASELRNNDGVYFIPAFSGLGPPILDDNAASGFIGLKVTSTQQHMVRAILEGIVYRITLLHNMFKEETSFKIKRICVDGGVSKNNFICRLLANLLGVEIARQSTTEMTTLGVAFMAGLNADVWKNTDELLEMQTFNYIFEPSSIPGIQDECLREFNMWLKAVDRFKTWYTS